MAHVTGTASDVHDALEKLRTELKTNATLAALTPAQTWAELMYVQNNIETSSTNATLGTTKHLLNLCRYDPRFVPSVSITTEATDTTVSSLVMGTSFLRFKFLTARAVTSILYKASRLTNQTSSIQSFRLQYSDDDSTWTTAATITNQTGWSQLEERTFSGWAATGSHLYWRILIDALGSGTTLNARSLLMFDGDEIVNSSEGLTVLKGPGLSGTNEIFIGLISRFNPLTSEAILMVFGFTGFLPAVRSLFMQPGVNQYSIPMLALRTSPMPYWFTMSGRRAIFVYKVGTIYSAGYAGFFLPYASEGQYPYPMAIGGSITTTNYTNGSLLPSKIDASHSVFCMPGSQTPATSTGILNAPSTLAVMQPTAVWESYANRGSTTSEGVNLNPYRGVFPQWAWGGVASSSADKPLYENVGGGYTLWSHVLTNPLPLPRVNLGELDGTKQISGHLNASENTGTFDGKPYVIFQNTYRSSITEFWALLAE